MTIGKATAKGSPSDLFPPVSRAHSIVVGIGDDSSAPRLKQNSHSCLVVLARVCAVRRETAAPCERGVPIRAIGNSQLYSASAACKSAVRRSTARLSKQSLPGFHGPHTARGRATRCFPAHRTDCQPRVPSRKGHSPDERPRADVQSIGKPSRRSMVSTAVACISRIFPARDISALDSTCERVLMATIKARRTCSGVDGRLPPSSLRNFFDRPAVYR